MLIRMNRLQPLVERFKSMKLSRRERKQKLKDKKRKKKEEKRRLREEKRKKKEGMTAPSGGFAEETKEERLGREMEDYKRAEHKILNQSWMMFDLQHGVSLDKFLDSRPELLEMARFANGAASTITMKSSPLEVCTTSESTMHRLLATVAMPAFDASTTEVMTEVVEQNMSKQGLEHIDKLSEELMHCYQALNANDVPIVIDSGASYALTPFFEDFITPLKSCKIKSLQGLSSKADVKGKGLVEWTIVDMFGVVRKIQVTACYVPSASIRLFSPQAYFNEHNGGSYKMVKQKSTLTMVDGSELEFPYNYCSNLPLMLILKDQDRNNVQQGLHLQDAMNLTNRGLIKTFVSLTHKNNLNLTRPQKEFLLAHKKWAHMGKQWQQSLYKDSSNGNGPIICPECPSMKTLDLTRLNCPTCIMAKATRVGACEAI